MKFTGLGAGATGARFPTDCARGEWQGGHRVGFDLTFSAESSFPVLFAAASPSERDRLRDAHDRAKNEALEFLLGEQRIWAEAAWPYSTAMNPDAGV